MLTICSVLNLDCSRGVVSGVRVARRHRISCRRNRKTFKHEDEAIRSSVSIPNAGVPSLGLYLIKSIHKHRAAQTQRLRLPKKMLFAVSKQPPGNSKGSFLTGFQKLSTDIRDCTDCSHSDKISCHWQSEWVACLLKSSMCPITDSSINQC